METKQWLARAKTFLYTHARLIDRRRFEFHFEGGSTADVIAALRPYQNADGGFGNALEPDIRCPYSQPVPVEVALNTMAEVGSFDLQVLEGIDRFLCRIALQEGGIPFVLSNVGDYPHAPWWRPDREDRPSFNPTGSIAALYKQWQLPVSPQLKQHLERSERYLWSCMEKQQPEGYHDGIHWIHFLEQYGDPERSRSYWRKIDQWLQHPGTIELDEHATGYSHKVLDWVPGGREYARKWIADEHIDRHLQALALQQQEDGGWPISWPALSPAVELEWRGYITVERLKTLKAYGWTT